MRFDVGVVGVAVDAFELGGSVGGFDVMIVILI